MKNYLFILLFLSCLGIQSASACRCLAPTYTFCETVFENQGRPDVDLIVKGKKLRRVEYGMDFEISLIIAGEETKKVIRVWGDNGGLCREGISNFTDNVEYLIAIDRINESHRYLEMVGDYSISVCGKFYWSYEDRDYETVEDIENCFGRSLDLSKKSLELQLNSCQALQTEIYPNPASNFCKIDLVDDINLQSGRARIFDSCGKEVLRFDNLNEFYSQDQLSFDLKNLQSGLYFLDLNLPEICEPNLTKRLVVKR